MHADEIDIDAALVHRLIAAQFPDWAELLIEPVRSAGTDNAMFRLGDTMAVRLPRRPQTTAQVEKEVRWLPRLAPRLPLAVPLPLAAGEPGEGYPHPWSVCRWLPGENAVTRPILDLEGTAVSLAGFVRALQAIDAAGGPEPGEHNSYRGVPLETRDMRTREAIASLAGRIDTQAATRAWQASLEASVFGGTPVWLHGDIHAGNLLVENGRVSAVIDFGCLGVGDPACDLMPAWSLLTRPSRRRFRDLLEVDDETWARGRGWALSAALIALPYYLDTNPTLVAISRRAIAEVLGDD